VWRSWPRGSGSSRSAPSRSHRAPSRRRSATTSGRSAVSASASSPWGGCGAVSREPAATCRRAGS
jgi:hypothetical protein